MNDLTYLVSVHLPADTGMVGGVNDALFSSGYVVGVPLLSFLQRLGGRRPTARGAEKPAPVSHPRY